MRTSARARVWRPVMILATLAAHAAALGPGRVAAADPVVLRVGEDAGRDRHQPVSRPPSSATSRSSRSTTTSWWATGPDDQPVPGSRSLDAGRQDVDLQDRPRTQMVGRHAGHVRGRALDPPMLLDGLAAERRLCRRGLSRGVSDGRGGEEVAAPDARPWSSTTEPPTPWILRHTCRSCRSTSGRTGRSARTRTTPRSSGPGHTRPRSGSRANTSTCRATPTIGGARATRTNLHPVLRRRRRDDRGAQGG